MAASGPSQAVRPGRRAFDPEAMEALLLAPWPDNLRGVQRLVHACAGRPAGPLGLDALPRWAVTAEVEAEDEVETEAAAPDGKRTFRPRPSREELVAALVANDWSVRATARQFERDRKQIARWIEMYAIEVPRRAAGST